MFPMSVHPFVGYFGLCRRFEHSSESMILSGFASRLPLPSHVFPTVPRDHPLQPTLWSMRAWSVLLGIAIRMSPTDAADSGASNGIVLDGGLCNLDDEHIR
jgi:hypothetical protein